ncbi:superinfection exclusion B family protein [Halomonas sp. 328]|uniref:superinfection exclusion B family protein n=1 Tax=Halomonas sp. 328 TaxID=2776704 RepID=UPI0018A7A5F2|nr:superinfection exclusion B family protein [Halomonas sp. 328]MBF8221033.1 superinfection exclusion B family protein [Halomonas sp. 328]
MEWISRIADLAKVPTRLVAVLGLASALLLFLPQPWLERLALAQLREDFAPYAGAVFVVSVSLLAVELAIWAYGGVQRRRRSEAAATKVQNFMLELDGAEKAVLREFLIAGTKSLRLPLEQPAVASLLNAGVLVQAASTGVRTTVGSVFSLSLSTAAQGLLSPTLLDLGPFVVHTDDGRWDLTEDGRSWLVANRPRFMRELERHFALFEERGF